jgi:hypothetical protein
VIDAIWPQRIKAGLVADKSAEGGVCLVGAFEKTVGNEQE